MADYTEDLDQEDVEREERHLSKVEIVESKVTISALRERARRHRKKAIRHLQAYNATLAEIRDLAEDLGYAGLSIPDNASNPF